MASKRRNIVIYRDFMLYPHLLADFCLWRRKRDGGLWLSASLVGARLARPNRRLLILVMFLNGIGILNRVVEIGELSAISDVLPWVPKGLPPP